MDIATENARDDEIETAQQCAPTKEGFVRFQAIDLLLEGYEKEEVARSCCYSVRTIERWVAAFNARGIDGLALKGRTGRPRKIPKDKFAGEIVPLVLDRSKAGEVHWSAVKLHGYLVQELHYELCYKTVLNYLREHDIKLLVPRKWAARQDQEKRQQFLKKIAKLSKSTSVEVIWRCLKERFFNNWYAETLDELIKRTCLALRSFLQNPDEVSSITSFPH